MKIWIFQYKSINVEALSQEQIPIWMLYCLCYAMLNLVNFEHKKRSMLKKNQKSTDKTNIFKMIDLKKIK